MRQIVLDTETTGLSPKDGHRIIEIGCVEMINREVTSNHYHQYIYPDREIDEGAAKVHGITLEFLEGKPLFSEIYSQFLVYLEGADEIIIHNAPFDLRFINHEFEIVSSKQKQLEDIYEVIDSLVIARDKHPGQRNSLDALCKRYNVDNSNRNLHGALLDAEILAKVYLAMTGGQISFALSEFDTTTKTENVTENLQQLKQVDLKVIKASESEIKAHHDQLCEIEKISGVKHQWES